MISSLKASYQIQNYSSIIILLIAIIMGAIAAINATNTIIFLFLFFLLIWLLHKKDRIPIFLLVTSSITLNVIFNFNFLGFDSTAMYKLFVIFVIIFSALYYGINFRNSIPVVALCFLLIFSYTFSNFHPNMSLFSPINTFLGFLSYFIILIVNWSKEVAKKIIRVIVFLPLISVLVGLLLNILGVHPFLVQVDSGATRWQGANMGPHLAMLAFVGFCASLIEIKRSNNSKLLFFCLAIVNFYILLKTGTRGPLISSIFIMLVYIASYIKIFMKGRILAIVPLTVFIIIIFTFFASQWDNLMLRTFNNQTSEIGFNFSGREEAWQYFVSNAKGNELFGQGLGAALVANDGTIYDGFTTPHNEYLRFYYDNGILGLILIFGSLLFVLINIGIRMPRHFRIHYFGLIFGFLLYTSVDNTLSTIHFSVPFCFYISALSSMYLHNQNKTRNKMYDSEDRKMPS